MGKIPDHFYFRVKVGLTKVEVEDASDADVVEVVRCAGCVHGELTGDEAGSEYLCLYYGDQWNHGMHYCSHGIPRKEKENETTDL